MSPAKHFAKLKHFLVRFSPFREGTFLIKGGGGGGGVGRGGNFLQRKSWPSHFEFPGSINA